MNDRYTEDRYFGPEDQYQVRGVGRSGGEHYSSAREYAAAGELGRARSYRAYGSQGSYGYGGDGQDRARTGRDYRIGAQDSPGSYGGVQGDAYRRGAQDPDRGVFERAGHELRSWFGDQEAERRREADLHHDPRQTRDERWSHGPDDHYGSWRRRRIAELDNDYDEYRRENAQRFENEFNSWRTDRQEQRDGLRRVNEHMEVIGSDGAHVGTVDEVRGDRILLTRNDPNAGGHHHSIPSRWIDSVSDRVTLRRTADDAQAAWRDEERSGALFGDRDDRDRRSDGNPNRSFSGTY